MFFILSKVLNFIIAPMLWLFILLLLAIIYKNKRKGILIFTFILFYLLSNKFLFNEVITKWEVKPIPIENIGKYDVAIVLGGFSGYDSTYKKVRLNEAGDRIWQALQLYETGKVKKIFISGGSGMLLHQDITEADMVKAFLLSLNIPKKDVIMEADSRNTHENAVNTAKWLSMHDSIKTYFLVTSAWHMPRALGCYKKVGINAQPYSTNNFSDPRWFDPDALFLPQPSIISQWSLLIREWVGWLSYKVVGYI
jgi:uncharacterized SAM-binding protein YcdF (DUF218 family)